MYLPKATPEADLASAKEKLAKQFSGNFDPRLSAIYIAPQGGEQENVPTEQAFPLLQEAAHRLTQTPLRSLLILGHSGMGKTCLSLHFCQMVWEWISRGAQGLPLPLYIYLPQYKRYLEEGLLEQVLTEAKLTKAERHVLTEEPLLLILDGFDEVSVSHNLYRTQRWGKRGLTIKMLVTCRPEALASQNAQDLFEASELFGEGQAYFNTMTLQAFSEHQIESYLKSYLNEQKQRGGECILSVQDYLDWLTRLSSLKALVRTPFLLTVVAQALPQIVAHLSHDDAITQKQITQNELFRHFLDNWFFKQAERVKAQGKLKGLSVAEVAGYMRSYAQNLAGTRMSREGQLDETPLTEEECLQPELVEPVHDKDLLALYHHPNPKKAQWRLFFTEDNQGNKNPILENIQAIRSGCLLHTVGERFKFLHKSITEYLAARELMEGLLGNYDSYLATLLGEDNQERGLNRVLLTKEPQIIKRLAEVIEDYPSFKELLSKILLASRETSKLSTAAANAITILNYGGAVFNYQDLSEVQIPGADLSLGRFYRTHFEGANLAGVNFRQANLSGANFRGANLEAVEFGERACWKLPSTVYCIAAYHPSPEMLHWLIGCDDGYVYCFEDNTAKQIGYLRHVDYFQNGNKAVRALSVHNACHYLATGGENSKIWLWDLRCHKILISMTGHTNSVTALTMTRDGKTLISGSDDKTVRLWSLPQGQPGPILRGHKSSVNALAVTPDGKTVLSGSGSDVGYDDNTVRLWSLPQGESGPILRGHTCFVTALALTPDGKTLMSAGLDNTMRLWSLPQGQPGPVLNWDLNWAAALAVTPDGKTLMSGSKDSTVRLWSLLQGEPGPILRGHTDSVTTLALTPDGKTLMSGSKDSTVRLWSLPQGELGPILRGHTDSVTALAVTPDGKTLISGGNWDSTVWLWSLAQGQIRAVLSGHTNSVTALAVTPDGKTLMSGSKDKTVRLWSLPQGQPGPVLSGYTNSVTALVVTPDGKTLISGDWDSTVRIWSLPQGQRKAVLSGHTDSVTALAVTPDGNTLISGSEDNTVRLWSLPQGQIRAVLNGHTNSVTVLVVTPDGKTLMSGSKDKTVRLWSLTQGQPGPVLSGYTNSITGLVVTPDGKILMSGSEDNTVRLWALPEGKYLSKIEIEFEITSLLIQDNQLIIGGYKGEILSIRLESLLPHNGKLIVNWLKGGQAKLCLDNVDLQEALNLSPANQALCEQRGAVGKPSHALSRSYQAWCNLFQPLLGSAHHQTPFSLIGTQGGNQLIQHRLTENSWVLSIARKMDNANRSGGGIYSFFSSLGSLAGTDSASHGFLILEGIKQNRRFIIRAELTVRTSHVQIILRPLDNLVEFKDLAQQFEAKQFQITADEGNILLRNIRHDQRKKINYSLWGDSKALSSTASSSASTEAEVVETHNCLSWCCKHVGLIGQEIKRDRWYNFFVTLPSDVTRPAGAANPASSSSSSSFQLS